MSFTHHTFDLLKKSTFSKKRNDALSSSSLLSDSNTWASGLPAPFGLAIYGSHMYVANYNVSDISATSISQLDLTNGSITNISWASDLSNAAFLVAYNNSFYVSNPPYTFDISNASIIQVSLLDGSITNASWCSGIYNPYGLVVYDSYMYAATIDISSNPTISKINLATGSIIDGSWAHGFADNGDIPIGLVINGSYIYVSNLSSGTISKINLADGSIMNPSWVSGLQGPTGLAIYGSYMYVSNYFGGFISQISLTDGSIINLSWASGLDYPLSIVTYEEFLYVANLVFDGTISRFSLEPLPPNPTPVPISNICFPGNTPIYTDQGVIAINQINPLCNTINKKHIIDITKTISCDNYLVCFEQNALGANYPYKETIMSKDHKIVYKGKLTEAYKFLKHFDKVKKVPYNQEILYNVLMEDYSKIRVNNLVCETLHPNNMIAKLHTRARKYTDKEMDTIVVLLQNCIKRKDFVTYKKISERC